MLIMIVSAEGIIGDSNSFLYTFCTFYDDVFLLKIKNIGASGWLSR